MKKLSLWRIILGVFSGCGLFIAIMLALAGLAIGAGWIATDSQGRLDLEHWLTLEVLGGMIASLLSGHFSRRVAGHFAGPLWMAMILFAFGIAEAATIIGQIWAGDVDAPIWLVLLAPWVVPAGALLGGLKQARSLPKRHHESHPL